MKRRHWISGVTFGVLTIFFAGLAFGESCPTLIGDWDVSSDSSAYDSTGSGCLPSSIVGCFAYVTSTGVLRIEGQTGCLFYGFYTRTDAVEPVQPLTGAIGSGLEIKMTGSATIVDGTLVGPRRINGLVSDLEIPTGRTINTARVTAIKRGR